MVLYTQAHWPTTVAQQTWVAFLPEKKDQEAADQTIDFSLCDLWLGVFLSPLNCNLLEGRILGLFESGAFES